MQSSINAGADVRHILTCSRCGYMGDSKEFRAGCPECRTSKPPIDPSTYHDPGEGPIKPTNLLTSVIQLVYKTRNR